MLAFWTSFLFVALAEMADKTQLLAIAFATRYKVYQVLLAISFATIVSQTLAVVVGELLTKVVPLDVISLIAAISFIIFGLWTLHGDSLNNENQKELRLGPIATVAIAFFMAEMGDKTQLATISLAIEYNNFLAVLAGTTIGMVMANVIGIIAGIIMKKHLPENIIKWFSAVIFIIFGLIGTYKITSTKLNTSATLSILGLVIIITATAIYFLSIERRNRL